MTLTGVLFVNSVKDCAVDLGTPDDDILDWPTEMELPNQLSVTATSTPTGASPTVMFGDPRAAFGAGVDYAAPGVMSETLVAYPWDPAAGP